jgi:hypothetical protein
MRPQMTMKPLRHAVLMGMTVAVVASGCGPADERDDRWDDDVVGAPAPEMTVQVAAVRSDVDAIVDSLRSEIDELSAGARDEPLERWSDVSVKLEETRGEVLQDLDDLDAGETDEARRVRDRAAERIAELEAEVARVDLEFAPDLQAVRTRAEERLAELEDNLSELAMYVSDGDRRPGTTPQRDMPADPDRPPAAPDRPVTTADPERTRVAHYPDLDLDQSELRSLQEDLVEARQVASGQDPDEDRDLDDLRDELSDSVADLTRDIRKHWHALRWTGRTQ